jgi:selenocysteine lyase/cysteine desulfurase
MQDLDPYRSEFPITETHVFMNHAAISAPPLRAVRALEDLFLQYTARATACYPDWLDRIHRVRELLAALLGAEAGEIAFVGNTSAGLSAVAAGLDWKPGDLVLVPEPEFPANVYPWMNLQRLGVETRFIRRRGGRFGTDEVQRALVPGARLLSVSSVDFSTGFYCNLRALGELCRTEGLLFCVDAIQSLGLIPMDVKAHGIHFLAAGGHKWLLGPVGSGVLFVDKEVNDRVHPAVVGWKSVVEEEDFFRLHFELKLDAARFEPGTMNMPGICGLGAALELLLEVGIEDVHQRVLSLNDLLYQGLSERGIEVVTAMGEEDRSGILAFVPASDPESVYASLNRQKVMVSLRRNTIRLSPHFYNNETDVNRLFQALDRL